MQELLQQLTEKFGVSESGGQSIVSSVLKTIGDNVPSEDFGALVDKIPGAKELAAQSDAAPEEASSGGGLLGNVAAMAASALGGDAGSAVGLTAAIQSAGVDLGDAGSIVETILSYFKEKAGDGLVGKLLENLPQLKAMLG